MYRVVIALLFVTLAVAAGATLRGGSSTYAGASNKVYWTDFSADKIQNADLDGSNVQDVITSGLDGPALMAIDVPSGKMYWPDYNAGTLWQADLDGSNATDFLTGLTAPFGVAYDPSSGDVFWTDFTDRTINSTDLGGNNTVLISSGLSAPSGIAVGGSKVYWTDSGSHRLQRADLDGDNVQTLIQFGAGALLGGVALDLNAGKVYWTDFGTDQIQRANLDGSSPEVLISSGVPAPLGIALDLNAGKMYWADDSADTISRADLDGSNVETLVSSGLTAPSGIALDVPVPPTPTPTATNTATPTNTPTPTPTNTPTPTPFPTQKASPTPKDTPTATPASSGSLQLDANCEDPLGPPKDTTVQKLRYVPVGATFHVCVVAAFPLGSASGYQVQLHWEEVPVDLNESRSEAENDIWHVQPIGVGGPLHLADAEQAIVPDNDDDLNGDAQITLQVVDPLDTNASTPYNGPVAQFEFTCESHGQSNLELMEPGDSDGTVLYDSGSPIYPAVSEAVVRCITPGLDSDVDGCSNTKELGSNEGFGGRRDPLYYWDFYDVWTHPIGNLSLWTKDRVVDLFNDIFGVAGRFGSNDAGGTATVNRTSSPFLPPDDETSYHPAFDRSSPAPGANDWEMGPPDGTIDLLNDLFGIAFQFGHNCM